MARRSPSGPGCLSSATTAHSAIASAAPGASSGDSTGSSHCSWPQTVACRLLGETPLSAARPSAVGVAPRHPVRRTLDVTRARTRASRGARAVARPGSVAIRGVPGARRAADGYHRAVKVLLLVLLLVV